MSRNIFGLLALAVTVVAGCSTSQPLSSCDLKIAQICSRAAEAQLHEGTLTVEYSSRAGEARVVPYVVPVLRPDGVLAAEVDCYTNTDSHTYSLVRSNLAIPPESEESVVFLRDRNLCADDGSYAENEHRRVGTASGLSLVSR